MADKLERFFNELSVEQEIILISLFTDRNFRFNFFKKRLDAHMERRLTTMQERLRQFKHSK